MAELLGREHSRSRKKLTASYRDSPIKAKADSDGPEAIQPQTESYPRRPA